MKKIALLVIAFALIIGMTQCKKKAATPVSDNGIQITLSANNGCDEKTNFDGTGFTWSEPGTEIIYVGGNNTGYLGHLTSTSNSADGKKADFSGSINNPGGNETLYFFYLGKGAVKEDPNNLDFSKQDGTIGNVTNYHIAMGSAAYSSTNTYTDVTFDMKMAIARFNTKDFDGSVYIHGDGIYSAANVNYQTGTITGTTEGFNLIGAAGENCYVAMIPQASPKETVVKFESGGHTGEMTFVRGIKENMYYCDNGVSLAVSASAITGVVKGLFSVEGTNGIPTKMVRFAPGNLQWSATGGGTTPTEHNVAGSGTAAGTWRFAEHQYGFVGSSRQHNSSSDYSDVLGNVFGVNGNLGTKCDNIEIASDYKGWIDLFGWATSGYSSGASAYQPYHHPNSTGAYLQKAITGTNSDWGIYNAIYNPSSNTTDAPGTWYTPTIGNWTYMIGEATHTYTHRTTTSGSFYVKAELEGHIYGLILFPDHWDNSIYTFKEGSINKHDEDYKENQITLDNWNTKLEPAGCVFLPSVGYLDSSVSNIRVNWLSQTSNLSNGYYWASTISDATNPNRLNIYYNKLADALGGGNNRGRAVRLIRTVD